MKNRRPRERQGKSRKTIGKSVENAKPGPAGKAVNFPHRMKNGPRHFRLSEFKVQQIVLHYLDVVGAFFFCQRCWFFPGRKTGGVHPICWEMAKTNHYLEFGAPFCVCFGLINVPRFSRSQKPSG